MFSSLVFCGSISILCLFLLINQYYLHTYFVSGADPNIGRLAFTAANADRVNVLKLLLDAGASVDGPKDTTILGEILLSNGSLECAQVLIESGADVSHLKDMCTKLFRCAAENGNLELVNLK